MNQNPQSERSNSNTSQAILDGALSLGGQTFRAVSGHVDRILAQSGTREQPTLWEWFQTGKLPQRS